MPDGCGGILSRHMNGSARLRQRTRRESRNCGPSSSVFSVELGKDPQIIAQAKELAEKYLQNQDSVDPTLAQTALEVAAVKR